MLVRSFRVVLLEDLGQQMMKKLFEVMFVYRLYFITSLVCVCTMLKKKFNLNFFYFINEIFFDHLRENVCHLAVDKENFEIRSGILLMCLSFIWSINPFCNIFNIFAIKYFLLVKIKLLIIIVL